MSLRRIAAEAGYSPGTIYSYFPDSRALYRAIRESDMENAILSFKRIVARTHDPAERVHKLFSGTVRYWLERPDQFDVLFSQPANPAVVDTSNGQPFGQSVVVTTALDIYYHAIEAFFDSLPVHPLSHRLAADALLAAVYGIIAFPRMTSTMKWSDVAQMADVIIVAMLAQWATQAATQRAHKHKQ